MVAETVVVAVGVHLHGLVAEFVRDELLLVFHREDILANHPRFDLCLRLAGSLRAVTLFKYCHQGACCSRVEVANDAVGCPDALEEIPNSFLVNK